MVAESFDEEAMSSDVSVVAGARDGAGSFATVDRRSP